MEINQNKYKNSTEIKELPKLVADKIAAGEVVDRPLSIVKELIENSIDAGADSIVAEIKNGGKTYIRITDNGIGISKEQAELAFKRHATSKIRESEDLEHITSLGFRGEALSSIAAVSKVELLSKINLEKTINPLKGFDGKTGVSIKIEGGILMEKSDIGCPEGTTVIVTDLFYNTPARHKFMKPDSTESTLIIDFVSKMALAYPKIKIRLINNGNVLFSTNGKNNIYSNILTIYSKEMGENLLHFSAKERDSENYAIEGYISAPNYTKSSRKNQIFFVNGRWVNSKILENAIKTAYAEKIFSGRYPIAFLFLKVAPELLDVNIHPNKKEVRFDDEKKLHEFVSGIIINTLNQKNAIPEIKEKNIFKFKNTNSNITMHENNTETINVDENSVIKEQLQLDVKRLSSTSLPNSKKETCTSTSGICKSSAESKGEAYDFTKENKANSDQFKVNEDPILYNPNICEVNSFEITNIKILSCVFNTYIIGTDEDSFYLIDQHAAHERIFYEEFLKAFQNSENTEKKLQQTIMVPMVIEVNHAIKNNAENLLPFLQNAGFDIETFGVKSFIIKGIPLFMTFEEAKFFIDDFFDCLGSDTDFKDRRKLEKIIMKSCKSAVKAKDKLDSREMEVLLSKLASCKNPYSCPHGRPIFIRMTQYEIEKMFKRV